jgi:type IV secretory pathway VirB10-like protein
MDESTPPPPQPHPPPTPPDDSAQAMAASEAALPNRSPSDVAEAKIEHARRLARERRRRSRFRQRQGRGGGGATAGRGGAEDEENLHARDAGIRGQGRAWTAVVPAFVLSLLRRSSCLL